MPGDESGSHSIICPFCGIDITNRHSISCSISQEETAKRDYSFESNWTGGYMKETKYIRHFQVLCCKHCYKEYQIYDKLTDKYSMFAAPIGILAGISYLIYDLIIHKFTISDIVDNLILLIIFIIFYGIIGFIIFIIPIH